MRVRTKQEQEGFLQYVKNGRPNARTGPNKPSLDALRAAVEADPAHPALWGLLAARSSRLEPRTQSNPPRRTHSKPPLVDPLALGNSRLTPDALWSGPDPVWQDDPEFPGDPEKP
jgi:hypothetical protein